MNNYNIFELKNRLKYITIPIKNNNSCSIYIYVKVGSIYENEEISGISHFIEHMVFKGGKKYKTAFSITSELDKLGTSYNAYTDTTHTVYHFQVYHKYIDKVLDIFSDMLFNSVFDYKEINNERNVIFEEMHKVIDDSDRYIMDLVQENIFPEHVLSKSVIGNKASLKKCTRKVLVDYYNKYYNPNNMVLSICGKYNENDIHSLIKKNFGNKKNKNDIYEKFTNYEFKKLLKSEITIKKKLNQSVVALTFPLFNSKDNRIYTAEIIENLLGSNMSSRLFLEIREKKGLVYSIDSNIEITYLGGYFCITFSCKYSNINKAVELILKELNKLRKKNITLKELNDNKTNLINTLYLYSERNSSISTYYGDYLALEENIVNYNDYIKYINKVSINDVKKLSNEIFDIKKMLIIKII